MVENLAVINEETGECQNVIVPWTPPAGCVAVPQNGIEIGDNCEIVGGVWRKKQ